MPRKKSTETTDKPKGSPLRRYECVEDAPWGGFLNARMDETNKARFYTWQETTGQRVWQMLDDALAEGIKFTLSYDSDNEAYIATFTGRLCASIGSRWAATSRAGTWEEALALQIFKHWVLAEGNWDDFMPKTGTFMRWG